MNQFTFIILLATLGTLVPNVFSSLAELVILARQRERLGRNHSTRAFIIAVLALLYSLWAVVGAGGRTVVWGFLLLAGVPL